MLTTSVLLMASFDTGGIDNHGFPSEVRGDVNIFNQEKVRFYGSRPTEQRKYYVQMVVEIQQYIGAEGSASPRPSSRKKKTIQRTQGGPRMPEMTDQNKRVFSFIEACWQKQRHEWP
jgi:hypothetical protein